MWPWWKSSLGMVSPHLGGEIRAHSLACLTPGMQLDGSEPWPPQTIRIGLASKAARGGVSFHVYCIIICYHKSLFHSNFSHANMNFWQIKVIFNKEPWALNLLPGKVRWSKIKGVAEGEAAGSSKKTLFVLSLHCPLKDSDQSDTFQALCPLPFLIYTRLYAALPTNLSHSVMPSFTLLLRKLAFMITELSR